MTAPLIVAITGATGVVYGVELLRVLKDLGQETHLILSEAGGMNLAIETDTSIDEVRSLATVVYNNKDVGAAVASGSFRTRGMIIAPCTIKTLSAIANSFTYNLVVRAADVQLKEGRKLVLMVRETPLHKGHLELMARACNPNANLPAVWLRHTQLRSLYRQGLLAEWQRGTALEDAVFHLAATMPMTGVSLDQEAFLRDLRAGSAVK